MLAFYEQLLNREKAVIDDSALSVSIRILHRTIFQILHWQFSHSVRNEYFVLSV
jgi:hypothetical protein